MKNSTTSREDIVKNLRNLTVLIVASLLAGLVSCKTTPSEKQSSEQAKLLEAWRTAMAQIPLPKEGSFVATYPNKEWREVPSAKAPDYPQPPRHGLRPLTVGNNNDVAARVPSGSFISTAIGSFDSVTGVTSESGPIGNTGPSVANAYTLQLNTDFFTTTDCTGSP